MNAARRNAARRGWPRGLFEPRPGYYVFRSIAGTTYAIGRVPLAVARAEANAANAHEAGERPGLVEKLAGATNTIGDILDDMDDPASAANTVKGRKSLDGIIRDALGAKACYALTVADCARLVDGIKAAGKARSAQAVRSRLIQVCRRGMQKGWLDLNHAEVTRDPKVTIKRGRLTMDTFHAIYEKAPEVAAWLPKLMMLGLVLGADRLSMSQLQRSNVTGEVLTYRRQKTDKVIAVPLALRMGAAGVSLAELLQHRGKVLSPYIIHHTVPQGQAKRGDPVHPDTMSNAFTQARRLAGIEDGGAPTLHELRSLSKRMHDAEGQVDTKALLGHAGQRVADLYANSRGAEPVLVRVKAAK